MRNVIENGVAEQLSEEAKHREPLCHRQLHNCKGQSAIHAAAIIIDRTHSALPDGNIPRMIVMDIQAAFTSVVNGMLNNEIMASRIECYLIRWTEKFFSKRTVEMIIEGEAMAGHPVEAGVSQDSPGSTILVAINN